MPGAGKRWTKGQSGNTSGRPASSKGLAKYIASKTKDVREVADFHLGVMRGEVGNPLVAEDGEVVTMPASIKDRQVSAAWLADRGAGKAPDVPEKDDADDEGDALTTEEKKLLLLPGGAPPEETT